MQIKQEPSFDKQTLDTFDRLKKAQKQGNYEQEFDRLFPETPPPESSAMKTAA